MTVSSLPPGVPRRGRWGLSDTSAVEIWEPDANLTVPRWTKTAATLRAQGPVTGFVQRVTTGLDSHSGGGEGGLGRCRFPSFTVFFNELT